MTHKQIAVRLPRLLDKDLNEARRLRPDAQSIDLNITPPSTASLTLPDGSGVSGRAFVELYNAKGSAGIFRVSEPETTYGSGERIALEHGICVLDDAIVPVSGTIEGAPRDVLEQILSYQTAQARGQHMWTLGAVEAPESETISVECDGTKTLEMLVRAVNAMDGYRLAFSQASFPWVVHVLKKPDAPACEGRMSRNIRAIRKTMDFSDLCTRLYCDLLEDGYIESDTVSAWGAVEQKITLNDDTPAADALAYCRRYLENRKNPTVAIEMEADEWYAMTGEPLDRFEIGDICRLALPDYGTTIEERIVAIRYTDASGRPEAATVSLANQVTDMSLKMAEAEQKIDSLKSTSTRYGNAISSNTQTITNLKDTAEGFAETDRKMTHWFNSVEIDLNAEEATLGLLASRTETYGLFEDADQKITDVGVRLDAYEAEMLLYARQTTVDELGEDVTEVSIRLDAAEDEIELKADKIALNGYVTASEFSTLEADLAKVTSGTVQASHLYTQNLTATNTVRLAGHTCEWLSIEVVTSASLSKTYATVPGGNGADYVVIGGVSLSTKTETIDYLGT